MALAVKSVIPPMEMRGFSIGVVKFEFASEPYAAGGMTFNINSSVFPGLLTPPDLVLVSPTNTGGYDIVYASGPALQIRNQSGIAGPDADYTDESVIPAEVTSATIYGLCIWFGKALSESVI